MKPRKKPAVNKKPRFTVGYFLDELKEGHQLGKHHVTVGSISPSVHQIQQGTTPGKRIAYLRCKSTVALSSVGAMISAAVIIDGGEFKDQTMIITDHLFDQLCPTSQAFFLHHEYGHIEAGDLDNRRDKANARDDRSLESEYDADMYAVSYVGWDTAIQALKDARKMLKSWWFHADLKELNQRITHLEKLYKIKKGAA